ncbi:MAG: chaplin [Streptomycetaceae bacterium]|nr:chaplin [Streptomycetaceae bacterium]
MRKLQKTVVVAAVLGSVSFIGAGTASANSGAQGTASNSPGVLSGNNVQVPVHVPVNVSGNTVNVIGLLNPATGNSASNS